MEVASRNPTPTSSDRLHAVMMKTESKVDDPKNRDKTRKRLIEKMVQKNLPRSAPECTPLDLYTSI